MSEREPESAQQGTQGENTPILVASLKEEGTPLFYAAALLVQMRHPLSAKATETIVKDSRLQALRAAHEGMGETPIAFELRLEKIADPNWDEVIKRNVALGFYTTRASRYTAMYEEELVDSVLHKTAKPSGQYAGKFHLALATRYKQIADEAAEREEDLIDEGATLLPGEDVAELVGWIIAELVPERRERL
jgi:hypothetical protein